MKLGIGVTTYKRPECYQAFMEQLEKNKPFYEYVLHVASDVPNIAQAKNECLYALRDCDYIFLFDDDCFPIKNHWDLPFISSGYQHLLYMNAHHTKLEEFSDVTRYQDCAGCFMFLTKYIFQKVGYMNSKYGRYGYEHLGYSTRIKNATNDWAFLCLNTTKDYIYSFDLQGKGPYAVHHEPTVSLEEKTLLSVKHSEIFQEEVNNPDKIYYEYQC